MERLELHSVRDFERALPVKEQEPRIPRWQQGQNEILHLICS